MSASGGVRLVLLGPPGAGKGTQAKVIEERTGARQISTGDILRANRDAKTPLGVEAQTYMDAGQLVPDDVIIKMMDGEIAAMGPNASFILDGFPRTVGQAQALDTLLAKLHLGLTGILMFDADRSALIERLAGRWTNPRTGRSYHAEFNPPKVAGIDDEDGGQLIQRPDDRRDVVVDRLAEYDAKTAPLIEYYGKSPLFVRIDTLKPIDAVSHDVIAAISKNGHAA
jgi:adenylate kinase